MATSRAIVYTLRINGAVNGTGLEPDNESEKVPEEK